MVQKLQAPQNRDEQESDSKRTVSSIAFPYSDLQDAITVAKAVFDHSGYAPCSRDQLSAWLNHESATSGTFRIRVAAARLFGLIELNHESVKLTQLGCDILDPRQKRAARVQTILQVPLYSKLYDRLKPRQLPSTIGLEQEMVDLGVAPKQKAKARQAFQRSADQAGFLAESPSRLRMPRGLTPGSDSTSRDKNTIPLNPSQAPASSPFPQYDYGGGSGGGSTTGTQRLHRHPLIQGLFQELPDIGTRMTEAQRDEWLELAKVILKRLYPDGQQGQKTS